MNPELTFTIPADLWLSANQPGAVSFVVEGEPVSKARARFTGYGSKVRSYTPAKTLEAERSVATAFRRAGGKFESDKEVTFGVVATFYNGTRQRRDVDNMLKLILDGLNGIAWVDDMQVTEVAARKVIADRTTARTEVCIYPVGRMDRLTRICEECGEEFVTYKSWGKKRHCSEDCALRQRRLARIRTCETCGKEWDPGKPSKARFCSRACFASTGWTEVECDHCHATFKRRKCHVKAKNFCTPTCRDATFAAQRKLRSKGECADCGTATSDKRAVRCQPCEWARKARERKAAS